jgi:hypothetical protein
MRHYASLCVIMVILRHYCRYHYASLCVIMRYCAHYASLCVTMRHYVSICTCVIMCHYVSLCVIMPQYICVIVRHYAKDQYASYVSLCVIMCHYASLCVIMRHYASLCVIMRYYGYFESLFVIMRAYFEGVRQMSFVMSRTITVVFFQKI